MALRPDFHSFLFDEAEAFGKPEDRANVMEFMASYGGAPAKPEPVAPEAEDAGEDAPGAGQGPVEDAEAGAAESATGMSADQPVPAANAAFHWAQDVLDDL